MAVLIYYLKIFFSSRPSAPRWMRVQHKILWEPLRWPRTRVCRLHVTSPPPETNPQSCLYSSTCAEFAPGNHRARLSAAKAHAVACGSGPDRTRPINGEISTSSNGDKPYLDASPLSSSSRRSSNVIARWVDVHQITSSAFVFPQSRLSPSHSTRSHQ